MNLKKIIKLVRNSMKIEKKPEEDEEKIPYTNNRPIFKYLDKVKIISDNSFYSKTSGEIIGVENIASIQDIDNSWRYEIKLKTGKIIYESEEDIEKIKDKKEEKK